MLSFRGHSTHEKYTDKPRHWNARSEAFAGGDHLLTAIRLGWEIAEPTIYAEQHWLSGTRPVTVYHFVLSRATKTMIMPVVSNPFVERLITSTLLTTVFETEKTSMINA